MPDRIRKQRRRTVKQSGAIDERIETNLVWMKLKTVKTSPGLNDCDSKAQSG